MKTFFILSLLLLISLSLTSGFSPCSANNRVRGVSSNTSNGGARLDTCLHAAAPKKKAAKKKTTKKAAKDSVETFKKSDFVSAVKDKTGLSKVDAEAALNAVLDTISEEVSAGKRINLQGFGTFKLSYRSARKGRNPQTGEQIDIAASNSPSFSASKTFKDKCNPGRA